MRSFFWVAVLSVAPGCGSHTTLSDHPCPPEGTTLTYDDFGKAFLDTWCQSCHGAEGDGRHGAPSSVSFGTREEARARRASIFAQSADGNTSMPVGPHGPSDEERRRLGEWLACGAP